MPPATGQAGIRQALRGLVLLSGVLMALSPFLSWLDVNVLFAHAGASLIDLARLAQAGTDDNTWLVPPIAVLGVAGLTILCGVLRLTGALPLLPARIWAAAVGVLGIGAAAYVFIQLERALSDAGISGFVSPGVGFYLFALASLVALVAAGVDTDA